MAEVTHDTLLGGRVALAQPSRGYRVNVDAVLLAAFAARACGTTSAAPPRAARALVDLGAGVGAVALCALAFRAAERAVLVEVDPRYASLAEENVRANGADAEVITSDVLEAAEGLRGAAELVVCNPPYVAPGRGRPAAAERARARSGPLDVFLDAARVVLGKRGRACFVYPAIEATTLLASLRARGLEPKRLACVHGSPEAAARVVLVEALPGKPGGLVVAPPIVETLGAGRANPALVRLIRG